MIKKIKIIAILLFNISTTAQTVIPPCPQNTVTTKPNATGSSNTWDWRINPIQIVEKIKNGTPLTSNFSNPYWDFNNSNTLPLVNVGQAPNYPDLRDYQPDEGWELIHKEFDNLLIPGNGIEHPMFVLYNKYRSVLRVFINISDREEDYNGVYMKLSFNNTIIGDMGNALYSYTSPVTQALDNLNANQDMRVFNQWTNVDNYWLYADFFVAYDPCTCNEQSKIRIEAYLSQTADVDLITKGKNTNQQTQDVVTDKTVNSIAGTFDFVMKFTNDATNAGNKKSSSAEKAIESANKLLKTLGDTLSNGEQKLKLPGWLKIIPQVGTVVGVLEFMFSGSNSEHATIVGTQEQYTSGTITYKKQFKDKILVVPGAKKGNAPNEMIPDYNNVLGVFNLLETPIVEYVDYYPNVKKIRYIQSNGTEINVVNPTIREYKLKKDLKYVLNPASQLKIKSMQCALVYQNTILNTEQKICLGNEKNVPITYKNKYNHGPFELGDIDETLNFNKRLENQGIFLNYWPGVDNKYYISNAKYNTRYVEKECFSLARFKVWNNDPIIIWCKLVITFTPINSNEEIMSVLTYPVTIEKSILYKEENEGPKYYFKNLKRYRERYFDWSCLCWKTSNIEQDYHLMFGSDCITSNPVSSIDPSPFGDDLISNTKEVIELKDVNFTQNTTIFAWKKIIVKNNVTMANGIELNLVAGEDIILNPSFIAKPGFKAIIGKMPFCNPQILNPVDQSEISTFCQSNKYKELIIIQSSKRNNGDSNFINKTQVPLNVSISPNPTSANFTVSIFYNNMQDYSIALIDVTGKVLLNNNYNGSQTSQFIETNGLASGIYFVKITCGNSQKTEKLIIEGGN